RESFLSFDDWVVVTKLYQRWTILFYIFCKERGCPKVAIQLLLGQPRKHHTTDAIRSFVMGMGRLLP
ncbi:hypothetical protein P4U72_27835, partial [Bacillus paranthracis]|uniref:hypothetical protein n=1 Tax=Bacillus paranthracis TaxID=2026186 RepID=UPI002E24E2F1|nr:hypothetical protein [Bacillus paranthracis]